MTEVAGEPREVGKTFATRWSERLPHDQAAELISMLTEATPRIPRSLDAELLRYAARFGVIGNDSWRSARNTGPTCARVSGRASGRPLTTW